MALTDSASYAAYRTGWSVVRKMPEPVATRMFATLGNQLAARDGSGVQRMRANYARVRPDADSAELDELVRQGMRSYMRYWCEAFRLPDWSEDRIWESHLVSGREHLDDALADGRGAICALPHMGNWDWLAAWACGAYADTTVAAVAERLKPERLYRKFLDYRESLGLKVIPLTGGEVSAGDQVRDVLLGNGMVALLSDRDLTEHGIRVQFFGDTIRVPAGPAALALDTGAALLPIYTYYDGPLLRTTVLAELVTDESDRTAAIHDLSQQLAHAFEGFVSAHLQDWHMMSTVWLADLSAGHRALSPDAE